MQNKYQVFGNQQKGVVAKPSSGKDVDTRIKLCFEVKDNVNEMEVMIGDDLDAKDLLRFAEELIKVASQITKNPKKVMKTYNMSYENYEISNIGKIE